MIDELIQKQVEEYWKNHAIHVADCHNHKKELEAHLRSSMLKVGEAARKEVTKTRDKLVDLYIKEHGRSIPNELADLALKVSLTDKGE